MRLLVILLSLFLLPVAAEEFEVHTQIILLSRDGDRALGRVMCGHPPGVSLSVPLSESSLDDVKGVRLWTGRSGRPFFVSGGSRGKRLKWALESGNARVLEEKTQVVQAGEPVTLDLMDFVTHSIPAASLNDETAKYKAPLPVGFRVLLTPLGRSEYPEWAEREDRGVQVSTTVLRQGLWEENGVPVLGTDTHNMRTVFEVGVPAVIENLISDLRFILDREDSDLGPQLLKLKAQFPQAEAVRVVVTIGAHPDDESTQQNK